jgi:hypothetical protein
VAHVADTQVDTCSRMAGAVKNIHADARTSKADLLAALKESFEVCDAVYGATTEANRQEGVPSFRGVLPRASVLYGNNAHDQEGYGNMVVYLRLNGLARRSAGNQGKKQ